MQSDSLYSEAKGLEIPYDALPFCPSSSSRQTRPQGNRGYRADCPRDEVVFQVERFFSCRISNRRTWKGHEKDMKRFNTTYWRIWGQTYKLALAAHRPQIIFLIDGLRQGKFRTKKTAKNKSLLNCLLKQFHNLLSASVETNRHPCMVNCIDGHYNDTHSTFTLSISHLVAW